MPSTSFTVLCVNVDTGIPIHRQGNKSKRYEFAKSFWINPYVKKKIVKHFLSETNRN